MKITQTKKGYTAVVYIGKDNEGKARSRRFTASSKAELKQMVVEYKAKRKVSLADDTFAGCLERYISARDGLKSPATIKAYRSIQRGLLTRFPAFCGTKIDRLTDRDAQEIVTGMSNKSWKTIQLWISLINCVMITERLPAFRVILPQKKIIDPAIPTIGEVKMILCLLHGHKLEIPFQLAIMGLRRGEICAVRASDLDGDVLHIQRAAVVRDGGGTVINNVPKTAASNRYVQLPHDLAEQLRMKGRATDYNIDALTRAFRFFLTKYRFPNYHLHDCRHFFASYCHSIGVPEADILAGGGWKTATVMRSVYRHSMSKNRASKAIGAIMSHS